MTSQKNDEKPGLKQDIRGLVFDIREFAVHDGPGIRTTVFMKGCPLTCTWCHNPEGRSSEPQVIRSPMGERISGTYYTAAELAAILNKQADILRANEGGVTFSGGEPLYQAEFIEAVIDLLDNLHVLIDTSGFVNETDFRRIIPKCDMVYFDLKIIDDELHKQFTGVSNRPILRNLQILSTLQVPFVIRVPLVPTVTDTHANLTAIAEIARGLRGLLRVDLLPYNKAAGAKYAAAGMVFNPGFDESKEVNPDTGIFVRAGLNVHLAR